MEYIELFEDNIDFYREEIMYFFLNNVHDYNFFHPHQLTWGALKTILFTKSKDCYLLMVDKGLILGYGLLRGWDEGFKIPSLGILIDKNNRGKGLSKILVNKLHEIAKERGSDKIRLSVYVDNLKAISLYKKLGYKFSEFRDTSILIGTRSL